MTRTQNKTKQSNHTYKTTTKTNTHNTTDTKNTAHNTMTHTMITTTATTTTHRPQHHATLTRGTCFKLWTMQHHDMMEHTGDDHNKPDAPRGDTNTTQTT